MSLHNTRASALLAWVNSLKLDDTLNSLSQLQDCSIFIKIINKIQGIEEGQDPLQQNLPDRVAYVVCFLKKLCKHKSTSQNLVSEEKLLAAEELELAKVAILLFYYASMSDKLPREWTTVEYELQTEMAKFLNFMLYNEDCLSENLETFLQKKMPQSSSSSCTSSEESTPPRREVHFLKLQKVASSSSLNKLLPGSSSASPMGDIMQTPQFQMRKLKKVLEAERENRDELEHELAENRKLIDEKETRILMMKQRIDRLTLLHERQAADQLEPKEMEELREKNESLLMRLHETLKQCQDLKTEKGQMDRKINQLSEENGDLTFRLREFARTLTEQQETMNELYEERNTTLREWEERRSCLETELHSALSEKRCLEEKLEILQGKNSLLEDQLAKLKNSSLPEKGEVMSDVLKLEDLNQQVAHLSGKQAELQATILRLEEEKRLLEDTLQSERSSFEAEKAQLTSLLTELQNSVSEISRAKEKLERDLRAQEESLVSQVNTLTAEIAKLTGFLHQKEQELLVLHQQKGQLAEDLQKNEHVSRAALQDLHLQVDQLSSALKQSSEKLAQVEAASQEEYNKAAQEKELALRQLQEKEKELSALLEQLHSLEQAQNNSAAEAQRGKAELSQRVQELEAKILVLTAQCQQSEAQAGAMSALKGQLREAQQKLADKDKLAKENTRLQERLLVLEESVCNTEGILEDEKRRAAESLESNLRRIAELEEQIQELTKHRDQAVQEMGEEKAKRQTLEGQVQRLGEESRAKTEELQQQLTELSSAAAATKGDTRERGKLEEKVQALSVEQEQTQLRLQAEQQKVMELEAQVKHLNAKHQEALADLQAGVSRAVAQVKEEKEAEEKLRAEVASLQEKAASARQEAAQSVAKMKEDGQEAAQALAAASKELAEEKLRRAELEAQARQRKEQHHKALSTTESTLSNTRSALKEKEHEVDQLSSQLKVLKGNLAEAAHQQKQELALREEEVKRLLGEEEERTKAELAAERTSKAALEVQLQNVTNERRVEVAALQEEVARAQELASEKERELEELRLKHISRSEELRGLQKTVSKLKGELASAEALKERAAKMESELQGFLEAARAREAEMDSIKSTMDSKDASLKSLEEEKRRQERETTSSRELYQEQLKQCEGLRSQLEKLERQCKEQHSDIAKLEKVAAASEEEQRVAVEALKREVGQHKGRASELEQLLEASTSAQESTVEKLKRELLDKGKELAQSREVASRAEKELAALRAAAQEKGKSEESWKEQMSRCLQEAERKASLISSLEQEMAIMHRQLLEKEAESKDLRRLVLAESEKSKKLEERLRILQSEMATAASRAADRCSAMKAEAQNFQEQAEKLRGSMEALKKREDDLCKELKSWQEKVFQKEQLLAAQQQEIAGAQALIGELMPVKCLYQQLQLEQASLESRHREKVEQMQNAADLVQAELSRAKLQLSELFSLKERCLGQERVIQQLQVEKDSYAEQLATLQRAQAQLAEQNRGLQCLDVELAQARQHHAQELEAARLDSEKRLAGSQQAAEEMQKKLEVMTNKYEETKQKLLLQVEQLDLYQKERAKQVEELKQKLVQQEKVLQGQQQRAKVREEELQAEIKHQNEKVADLQAQLAQKEQAAEHYKTQMEKAKTHYDAKKQQNQELLERLGVLEEVERENAELKAESERLVKEQQDLVMQMKEAELTSKNLTSRVCSLEAQVEFADRQLREQGKFQAATDPFKSSMTFQESPVDVSTDSLDLSTGDEAQPLNSTSRKSRRSLSEPGAKQPLKASRQLPRQVESLESLYFTPIPTRTRSKLESSVGSVGDTSFESGRKTLSGRRRTTQKHAEAEAPASADESFFSIQSAASQTSTVSQEPVRTRLRSAAASSTRSLASLPSQESLTRLSASSPDNTAALMSLPGYRPATRSSMRRSQAGGASSGRSSFYMGTCQEEPEVLDDWSRIAELQQRNRVCPPHLKTCYPLESRPSLSLATITDEEMKTGDPKETLRRASMLPSQVTEGPSTRRSTLSNTWAVGGVATRQQRKRVSEESQQAPGTPESKKSASCFPRPQTPKGRTEEHKQSSHIGNKKSKDQASNKQSDRRQSFVFSILNTPKKLGNSLLRRGPNRKVTPKNSPRKGSRRSPRAAASPKGQVNSKSLKNAKF